MSYNELLFAMIKMTFDSKSKPANEELTRDICDLVEVIAKLPKEHREAVQPALDKAVDGIKRRRRILKLVQEALSQLRLDMKYLVFDLEATRRERDSYKKQLED